MRCSRQGVGRMTISNELMRSSREGVGKEKKLKREKEKVLVRGWDIRLFQTSKWDLLVRGLVMKRKFETREWDVLVRGEDDKIIWNERMRFSRQRGGNQRIFETSKWDALVRGVMWFWKYFLNIILKPNQVNSEEKVSIKRDFLASKRDISSILCQCWPCLNNSLRSVYTCTDVCTLLYKRQG